MRLGSWAAVTLPAGGMDMTGQHGQHFSAGSLRPWSPSDPEILPLQVWAGRRG